MYIKTIIDKMFVTFASASLDTLFFAVLSSFSSFSQLVDNNNNICIHAKLVRCFSNASTRIWWIMLVSYLWYLVAIPCSLLSLPTSNFIQFFHLLNLPSSCLPRGLPTKILYVFLFPPPELHAQFVTPWFDYLSILDELYISQSSSWCNIFHFTLRPTYFSWV